MRQFNIRKDKTLLAVCLLAVTLLLLAVSTLRPTRKLSAYHLDNDTFAAIIATRTESPEPLLAGLLFDEQALAYAVDEHTYYYSLVEGSSSAFDPAVSFRYEGDQVHLGVVGDITPDTIEQSKPLALVAYTDTQYTLYNIYATTLPILQLEVDAPIGALDERWYNELKSFTLFDNREGATQALCRSQGQIRLRGQGSRKWAKQNFRIGLTKESPGRNQRKDKISLLGMREDEDWLLFSCYNDQEKLRSAFSTDLWRTACGNDTPFHFTNGCEFRYVELLWNGEYMGLYGIGSPIDKKTLEIGNDDVLYKAIDWVTVNSPMISEESFLGGHNIYTQNSQMDTFQYLADYYSLSADPSASTDALYAAIDPLNAADIYLFLNLVQGMDHLTQNGQIRNIYMASKAYKGSRIMLYTPWDLDYTWGNCYTDEAEKIYTEPYSLPYTADYLMDSGALFALLQRGDPQAKSLVQSRWATLRAGAWSDDAIDLLLDEFEDDIYNSGAFLREMRRWPEGNYNSPEEKLTRFRSYVHARLAYLDNFDWGTLES